MLLAAFLTAVATLHGTQLCAPSLISAVTIPHRFSDRIHMLTPATSTAIWVGGTVLGGTAGTPLVVAATKTWYRKISLPAWTPPNRVFAPAWTTLYTMIGLATARVAASAGLGSAAIRHFVLHYAVNLAWAPVFFGLQRLRLALAMNIFLVNSLAVLMAQYFVVTPCASMLLVPYMAWLLFATRLNAVICSMNPTFGGYNNAMMQADLSRLQRRAASIAFAT